MCSKSWRRMAREKRLIDPSLHPPLRLLRFGGHSGSRSASRNEGHYENHRRINVKDC